VGSFCRHKRLQARARRRRELEDLISFHRAWNRRASAFRLEQMKRLYIENGFLFSFGPLSPDAAAALNGLMRQWDSERAEYLRSQDRGEV
jgi:hypothetical protein